MRHINQSEITSISVVLLDVAMETVDAGLRLVRTIREALANLTVRIPDASRRIDLGDPVWVRHHGDMTVATYRLRGTFKTDFNYGDYPLDRQKLVVALRPKTRTAGSLVLAIDEAGMSMVDRRADELALSKLNTSFAASPWQPQNSIFYESIFKSDSTLGE